MTTLFGPTATRPSPHRDGAVTPLPVQPRLPPQVIDRLGTGKAGIELRFDEGDRRRTHVAGEVAAEGTTTAGRFADVITYTGHGKTAKVAEIISYSHRS